MIDAAIADALNETAVIIRKFERLDLPKEIKVRKPRFWQNRIARIRPMAGMRHLDVTIAVNQSAKGSPLILGALENGGSKQASDGRKFVAIPITGGKARAQWAKPVSRAFFIDRLGLVPRKSGKGMVGNKRTVLLPVSNGLEVLYQRSGHRGSTLTAIYLLVQSAKLPKKIRWIEIAIKNADKWTARKITTNIRRNIDSGLRKPVFKIPR